MTTTSPLRALLLENVHPDAAAALSAEGFEVETAKGALDPAELAARLSGVSLLGLSGIEYCSQPHGSRVGS